METSNFNIGLDLDDRFVFQLNMLRREFGSEMERLNGFSNEQLNFTEFIDNFVDKQVVADATIDGNANASSKDICSMTAEMMKPHLKLISFNKIYVEMCKKYGDEAADAWLRAEWLGKFYMHDAPSSSQVSYCFAYDLENLVKKGLYFVNNFNAKPPKHLVTYTDFVGEFISYNCNRTSGAVGLPSFLVYSFYFWKKDCESNYFTTTPEVYRDQEFQRIVYKLNQPYLRVNQSAFTNFSIFDTNYYLALFGGKEFPDGTPMAEYVDEFMDYQKAFMEVVSKIRSENMMTFPVLTFSLLRQKGKFADEEFAKWCCKHNMKWNDSNFYISDSVDTLSNCCRLVSDVKKLGYFNSIGGTSLEVGSVKVSTVNLATIAYETKTIDEYLALLKKRVLLDCQALDIQRGIIKRNIEKGLLPNYKHELVHMKSQYSTIGVIGIYEVLDKFGMVVVDEFGNHSYSEEGVKFAKQILKTINKVKDNFSKNLDYQMNVEQIPAERAAAVLMQKDKVLFPNEKYELPLYGNQWIPLGVKCTIADKLKVSAALDKSANGGSISHINLDAPIEEFDTAWKLLNDVADSGVPYFSFCTKISSCEENHGFYGEVCPICGKKAVKYYTRIVGFLVPTTSFSSERKAEFGKRLWYDGDAKA